MPVNSVSNVDVRLLSVFVKVVECGGLAGAQTALDIGLSAISLHLSNLEQRLGFRLCSRGRGGFALTERGEQVYAESKRLLASLDSFAGEMAALRNRLGGRLGIGMVDGLVSCPDFPLVEALRRFRELDHEVTIELVVAPRQELERGVLDGRLHAAIGPHIRRTMGIETRELFAERHRVYCGPGHPLFGEAGRRLRKTDLAPHATVLRGYHGDFDLRRFGHRKGSAAAHSLEAILVLLLSGGFIGYLPDHFATPWVERGELRLLDAPGLAYLSRHVLMTRQGAPHTAALAELLEALASATPDRLAQAKV